MSKYLETDAFLIEAAPREPLQFSDVQQATNFLSDILGVATEPECHEDSMHVATRLKEIMLEKAEGDAAHQVEQFAKDSKVGETFQLLRCAAYLASNNLLAFEKGADLLWWSQCCNTFWVLRVCVDTHTPAADAFASVLLVSAASLNDSATCQWLLELGTDPKAIVFSSSDHSTTALVEAVREQDSGLVGHLVDKGADMHVAITSAASPLNAAIEGGSRQIIQTLVKKGADIHQLMEDDESEHDTIFNFAVRHGDVEMTTMLLQSNPEIASFPKQLPTPFTSRCRG